MAKQFRTRTHGTSRQIGNKFALRPSRQALQQTLPKVSGKAHVHIPARDVELTLKIVNTKQLVPSHDGSRKDFEASVQHIIDMYKNGRTIPPLLVHRLPSGKYQLLDGHARAEAFRRLGVTRVPVVENGLMEKLSNAAKWVAEKGVKGVKAAWAMTKKVGHGIGKGIEKAAIAGARTAGRAEALQEEMKEAYSEAKEERPWEEKGEIAKHLEGTPKETGIESLPEAESTRPFSSPSPLMSSSSPLVSHPVAPMGRPPPAPRGTHAEVMVRPPFPKRKVRRACVEFPDDEEE
jgi:hypothetical protein